MTTGIGQGQLSDFDDIIALKLKKPKSWNWQLSTSKSSPHILLPVIKLYDYKGNLLLETRDAGPICQRRSWHSGLQEEKLWRSPVESKFRTAQLERSCSDKRDVPTSNKQEGSISRTEKRRSDKNNNNAEKTSSGNTDMTNGKEAELPRTTDAVDGNAFHVEKKATIAVYNKNSARNNLKKSRSDFMDKGVPTEGPQHRRTKSDDAFRRKLKYNEAEYLKRAVVDGNENCTNYENSLQESASGTNRLKTPTSHRESISLREITDSNTGVIQQTIHPRYKTRTSSAGTLIISEESFYKPNRRKRPERENTSAYMTSAKISKDCSQSSILNSNSSKTNEADVEELSEYLEHRRRRSTLTSGNSMSCRVSFPPTDEDSNSVNTVISHVRQRSDPLWYQKSWTSSKPVHNDEKWKSKKLASKSERLDPSDSLRGSSIQNIDADNTLSEKSFNQQQHHKKKRRKVRRQCRHSDGSSSSNADIAERKTQRRKETSASRETSPGLV